ncbi:MAG: sortase [Patescibacteria group bacterium]|nr:sortase [Patescibacteria group bacterium]
MTEKGVIGGVMERPVAFAATFIALFFITYAFLSLVGMTPDDSSPSVADIPHTTPVSVQTPQEPVHIVAKSINLDSAVSNPATTSIDVMDQDLLKGAVRYPTSNLLGVDGTVLIFGHSSYLPIVHNRAYKTFDGIQDLKAGDTVSVYSSDTEYRYSVVGVRLANAEEDVIDLPQDGKHLTLVTCDSFATKSTRFVVTADFVGAYAE